MRFTLSVAAVLATVVVRSTPGQPATGSGHPPASACEASVWIAITMLHVPQQIFSSNSSAVERGACPGATTHEWLASPIWIRTLRTASSFEPCTAYHIPAE
jgi:hypothetical protein